MRESTGFCQQAGKVERERERERERENKDGAGRGVYEGEDMTDTHLLRCVWGWGK